MINRMFTDVALSSEQTSDVHNVVRIEGSCLISISNLFKFSYFSVSNGFSSYHDVRSSGRRNMFNSVLFQYFVQGSVRLCIGRQTSNCISSLSSEQSLCSDTMLICRSIFSFGSVTECSITKNQQYKMPIRDYSLPLHFNAAFEGKSTITCRVNTILTSVTFRCIAHFELKSKTSKTIGDCTTRVSS